MENIDNLNNLLIYIGIIVAYVFTYLFAIYVAYQLEPRRYEYAEYFRKKGLNVAIWVVISLSIPALSIIAILNSWI